MTKQEAVDHFIKNTTSLTEVEYGDFKRKVGLYLQRLEEGLNSPSSDVQILCDEVRRFVVYQPTGDIEQARHRCLELARRIGQQI